MNTAIKALTDEAHEIIVNIRAAAQHGEITWQQRDELINLVLCVARRLAKSASPLARRTTGREMHFAVVLYECNKE